MPNVDCGCTTHSACDCIQAKLKQLESDLTECNRMRRQERERITELEEEVVQAKRWAVAWKTAAKEHRQGRHLAAHLFAKYLIELVACQKELESLRRNTPLMEEGK
jgi:U3 small nucleolar ribonucleoprotein component